MIDKIKQARLRERAKQLNMELEAIDHQLREMAKAEHGEYMDAVKRARAATQREGEE